MARILAIDYGAKRCGLAVTDMLNISINPLPTISTDLLEIQLSSRFQQGDITTVVMGWPTHADGTPTYLAKDIEKCIERWKKIFSEIHFVLIDESFTSKEAIQVLVNIGVPKKKRHDKSSIDQMSAVLILKKYLESL